ncbi:MAG: hypothetical protein AAB519_03530 [Patescibacteria group bacterium]
MENVPEEQKESVAPESVVAEAPVAAPAPEPTPAPAVSGNDVEDNKLVAALSYVSILFLVPLLAKKESPFCQFHAKQGLVLCVASFVFSFIPVIGWLANVGLLVVAIIAIIQTLSGKSWEIPVAYDLSKKINL